LQTEEERERGRDRKREKTREKERKRIEREKEKRERERERESMCVHESVWQSIFDIHFPPPSLISPSLPPSLSSFLSFFVFPAS